MSATDASPAKKPKTELQTTVSELFPLTPDVDIFVRSKETGRKIRRVHLFGTSKLFLQAASAVFRDTLANANAGETHESIPIIDVEEVSAYVHLFLVHLHPGKLIGRDGRLEPQMFHVDPDTLWRVAQMAEKYDAPLVLNSVLNTYLPFLYDPDKKHGDSFGDVTCAINAFGIAVVHQKPAHVRGALRSLDAYKPDETCDDMDDEENAELGIPVSRAREFNLSHILPGILAKMPSRDIAEFCRLAGKIGPRYSWTRAATDFKIYAGDHDEQ